MCKLIKMVYVENNFFAQNVKLYLWNAIMFSFHIFKY